MNTEGQKTAIYRYYHGKIEADNEHELWLKAPEVCQPNHHKFYPVKRQTPWGERLVDECPKCMTIRIPSRGVYPVEKPESYRISKRTRNQMKIL